MIKVFNINDVIVAASSKKDVLELYPMARAKDIAISKEYDSVKIINGVLFGIKKKVKTQIVLMTENVKFEVTWDSSRLKDGLMTKRKVIEEAPSKVPRYLETLNSIVNDSVDTLSKSEVDEKRDELWKSV